MAECFEETEKSYSVLDFPGDGRTDVDRQNDNRNFRCDQFLIFKHNFRAAVEAENTIMLEGADSEKGNDLLTLNKAQKKSIVNIIRKLEKAQTSLEAKEKSQKIAPLITELHKIKKELISLIRTNVDFSPVNAPLPDFDSVDIELLFGTATAPVNNNKLDFLPEKWSLETKKLLDTRIMELLGASEILLNEYEDIK